MRILLVPHPSMSHAMMLLALMRELPATFEAAFLLPRSWHARWRSAGVPVLDIDYDTSLRAELQAYRAFSPDVVVDDCSLTTGFAVGLTRVPRATILRAAYSTGYRSEYPHAFLDVETLPDVTPLGLSQPRTISDMFQAARYIVPGIDTIELIDRSLLASGHYVFAGSLRLPDDVVERLLPHPARARAVRAHLAEFFAWHRGRKIVCISFGTLAETAAPVSQALGECVRHFVKNGIGVVTTVAPPAELMSAQEPLLCYASFLPMDYVCSNSDILIYHGGSRTYHDALQHALPGITIGTRTIEREDIGLRLQELGVSTHFSYTGPECDLARQIIDAVDDSLQETWRQQFLARLTPIRRALNDASRAFCVEDVLREAGRRQQEDDRDESVRTGKRRVLRARQ
jgi:UDP:flavonoid glycosyltransferase YjiC (YdhE family)